MKRILTTLCALAFVMAGSIPALAAEADADTGQSASYYPISVEEYTYGSLDEPRVEKVYQLSLSDDPSGIPTEDFVRNGRLYYLLDMTRKNEVGVDMRVFYSFTEEQNEALDELLASSDMLMALAGDLTISSQDAKELLANLPTDLSPERRAVVETACRLVGKVNYFWGGKSLVLGWDDRWGTLRQVTAAGSSTTGTYRPYGMDCSGYVDWVLYNVSGGAYVIGHGGGAHAQHTYCTTISWDEALPGDLVFYPEDSHVGIVGGRDKGGELRIIHCSSGYNNVVITGIEGFTSIGRPVYYSE